MRLKQNPAINPRLLGPERKKCNGLLEGAETGFKGGKTRVEQTASKRKPGGVFPKRREITAYLGIRQNTQT